MLDHQKLRHGKKESIRRALPGDVRIIIDGLAKRFRTPGLNFHDIQDYFHQRCLEEALFSADQEISGAAKNLGIEYMTLYMYVKRKQNKMKKDFNVGET